MIKQEPIFALLNDVVADNPTYDFPISTISVELNNMFANKDKFDEVLEFIINKLKRRHSDIVAHVFILCVERSFPFDKYVFDTIPLDEYYSSIEDLYDLLSTLKITRVDKLSPDGEMMSQMS
jgi:hypothetical protein